ncbi:MAG: alpha/beta hydrolase [Candidatus Eisenbacteria bacterium]
MRLLRLVLAALALAAVVLAARVQADPPAAPQTTELGRGTTIVFVHSLGAGRMDWMPTARKLIGRYRVVLVDLPGHGTSPLPDPFSLEAAAELLDAVIARQKAESTVVVGQGVGGMIALKAVAAHPDHSRGLLLLDTAVKSPLPVGEQEIAQITRFMDDNYATFLQMAFSRMGRDSTESAKLFAMMSAAPPATVKAYLRSLFTADANRDLKSLKTPPALVFTERMWKPGTSWGTLAKGAGYEDSTFAAPRRLAGAGMLVMKDQPDTLAAIVSEFANARVAAK